jgi:hypothetical protein
VALLAHCWLVAAVAAVAAAGDDQNILPMFLFSVIILFQTQYYYNRKY